MPRRIEIELTSARPDGAWTWRAAGAREPKGTVDGSMLPDRCAVGDVLKVEADFDVEGITVIALVSVAHSRKEPTRIELIPSARPFEAVTQQLAGRPRRDDDRRDSRDRGDRGDRGDRPAGDRGTRPPRTDRPAGVRPSGDRGTRPPRTDRPAGDRPPPNDGARSERGPRGPRDSRPARPHFVAPPEMPQRARPKRLKPGRTHRAEVLAAIPEEQRSIAELTLQGLAAVRQRLRDDNVKLKAEGKPEMPEASVMKMAEELMPRIRVAEWLDRAEAAKRDLDDLDLRDLRSVVASSADPILARDESTRALAAELTAALAIKQESATREWIDDIATAIDIGRVVRALKMSSEPPKAGLRFPADLGAKLSLASAAALTSDASSERWVALVESVAFSPVRTLVRPTAPPTEVSDELRSTVTRLAPAIPQIAALFGIEVAEGAAMPKPPRVTRRPEKKPTSSAGSGNQRPAGKAAATPAQEPAKESAARDDAAPVPDLSEPSATAMKPEPETTAEEASPSPADAAEETVTEPAAAEETATEPEPVS